MSQLIRSCLLWCLPALAAYPIQLLLMGMIVPTRLRRWWQYLLVSFGVCLFNVPKVIWGAYSLPADVFRLLAGPVVLVVIPVLLFAGPVWKRLLTNFILYCVQAAAEMLAFSLLRDPELLREGGAAFTTFAESASYTAVATLVYALFGGGVVILARSLQAKRFSGVYLPGGRSCPTSATISTTSWPPSVFSCSRAARRMPSPCSSGSARTSPPPGRSPTAPSR